MKAFYKLFIMPYLERYKYFEMIVADAELFCEEWVKNNLK